MGIQHSGERPYPIIFSAERRYFQALRGNCPPAALAEYRQAVSITVERYNTTVRENRFIVGGAVEIYTVALMRSAGIDAHGYGAQMDSSDLILPNGKALSVKSQFTKSRSKFKLINTQSNYTPEWHTATLFIIAGIGIVYGDPAMTEPTHLVRLQMRWN